MIRNDFQDKSLSRLGFGTMRLPTKADGQIDEAQVQEMVDYAMAHGVNYFDTAYPYHEGLSETVIGRCLSKYPRESFFLATKYPGHQIAERYDPAEVFEKQLKKCGVDYFDFYLLHNIYEKSIDVYLDPQWGIVEYFLEQKRLGRIKHLGFSTHARLDTMERFLDAVGEHMEFCQIQLNYLDWTLQKARSKYDMLTRRGIPVWVMEPVRGGKLVSLPGEKSLHAMRPDEKTVAWAFRFLQGLPNCKMILSGMSNMAQMVENIKTFEEEKPLNREETALILAMADTIKGNIPCTACRYCCDSCPQGLDIPVLLNICNDLKVQETFNVSMAVEAMPEEKRPQACIACGKCMKMCPQNIQIPKHMQELTEIMKRIPSWEVICRQRAEAAKRT
ncbi:MAG: aldo/keto reductase [Oscillospiraceae bacterium]|nr:aldo/keto reductase [Oscillospiraceae bacterium]